MVYEEIKPHEHVFIDSKDLPVDWSKVVKPVIIKNEGGKVYKVSTW